LKAFKFNKALPISNKTDIVLPLSRSYPEFNSNGLPEQFYILAIISCVNVLLNV